jgi:methionine-rich copper-binding protein CopC
MARPAIPRWCGVVVGLLVLVVALLTARPASAHPTLIQTQPLAGYAVVQSPAEIVLVFDERVKPTSKGITLEGQARGEMDTGPPQLSADATTVTVRMQRPLPDGQYTVRWEVVGEDGHTAFGAFGFGLGTSAPAGPRTRPRQQGCRCSRSPAGSFSPVSRWH